MMRVSNRSLLLPYALLVVMSKSNLVAAGCDTCIQSAAQGASSSMQSALSSLTSTVNQDVSATNTLNSTVNTVGNTIQATMTANHELLLQGLSASSKQIELSIQANTKSNELLNDHLVLNLGKVFKEIFVSEQTQKTNRTYDNDIAQPLSGDIGANRAPLLKQANVQSEQIKTQMSVNMYEWLTSPESDSSRSSGARTSALLLEDNDVWDPTPIIGNKVLTDEQYHNAQKLLTVLITPVPLEAVTDGEMSSDPTAAGRELSRKLYNVQASIAHSILTKSITDRLPLIPISTDDWKQGYISVENEVDGKTSMLSFLESETMGRLMSEGWYKDVKTKTEAGILREQVYMQAIRNKLALRMLRQEEDRLMLEALNYANKVGREQ